MTSTDKSAEREALLDLARLYCAVTETPSGDIEWSFRQCDMENFAAEVISRHRASLPPADPGAVAPADALYEQIQDVLLAHRLSYTYEDEDSALPLVDMLCATGAKDVATGKEEITLICDAIYSEVLCPYFRTGSAAPSVPSAPAESGWQPIEAAPKSRDCGDGRIEGVYLLGFCPDADVCNLESAVCVIWWEPLMNKGKGMWYGEGGFETRPTHFMPLPAAPQAVQAGGEGGAT